MSIARTLRTRWAVVCIAGLLALPAIAAPPKSKGTKPKSEGVTAPASVKDFLAQNCIDCHDGPGGDGGLDLAALRGDLTDAKTMARWERIFDRVHDGEMPPADAGELDPDQAASFLSAASTWMHNVQQSRFDSLGRVQSRRLTNLQLQRTLHDLLAIDVPLASLMTEEPRVEGFTGLADHQSMSHFQLDTHLTVVDAALDAAFERVAEAASGEDSWTRDYTAREIARKNPKRRCRDPEMIDGEAVVWSSNLIFYGRITSTTAPKSGWYEITVSASAVNKPEDSGVWCAVRTGLCTSGAPLMTWVGAFEAQDEPVTRTFRAWLPEGHMFEIRPYDATLKLARFRGGQVGAGEGGPQNVPGVAMQSMTMKRIHPGGDIDLVHEHLFGDLDVRWKKKDKRLHLSDGSASFADLAKQLRRFTDRAFRREVSDDDFKPYVEWLRQSIDAGEEPIDALRASYRAVLCSPRFLYFVEPTGKLDGPAIASRISYLVTGSMPDDDLMRAAHNGELETHSGIIAQLDRLLDGDGTEDFVADFADQWLDMNDIDFTEPDRKLYRDFDIIVQNAMQQETHRFLTRLIQEDGDARRLIRDDQTYLNSRLARYYDIDGITGDQWQCVSLQDDSPRGGLLGQGSILKITANGTNTSPVLRGIWVSERILGVAIPPPPENVPAVEPDIRGAKTIREQLQKHLADESCHACHRNIDPPGYALESFDAAGQWRDRYLQVKGGKSKRGLPVEPGYVLADGRRFEDFNEFRDLICDDIRPVARNFAAHVLVYATGAPIGFADREDLEQIVDRAAKVSDSSTTYGLRSLLRAVVTSEPFLSK